MAKPQKEKEKEIPVGKLRLEVITAEDGRVVCEDVDEVVLEATNGSFGVRPGHAFLLARLTASVGNYREGEGKERKHFAVSGGFAQVDAARVRVLADDAVLSEKVDLTAVKAELAQAREQLAATVPIDLSQAQERLAAAVHATRTQDGKELPAAMRTELTQAREQYVAAEFRHSLETRVKWAEVQLQAAAMQTAPRPTA